MVDFVTQVQKVIQVQGANFTVAQSPVATQNSVGQVEPYHVSPTW